MGLQYQHNDFAREFGKLPDNEVKAALDSIQKEYPTMDQLGAEMRVLKVEKKDIPDVSERLAEALKDIIALAKEPVPAFDEIFAVEIQANPGVFYATFEAFRAQERYTEKAAKLRLLAIARELHYQEQDGPRTLKELLAQKGLLWGMKPVNSGKVRTRDLARMDYEGSSFYGPKTA